MGDPDWFFDPVTGRRAPAHDYSLGIDSRSETVSGNVKQVWELSRLHHLTLLAAAFALSGEPRYAERVADHLRSWWAKNRFLSGIHWTSGIELGIRLISFVWIRRLLDAWDGVESLFDDNSDARVQIWWHQRFLAGFQSRGSSANNHVIAEAAGQLIASLAFPWFPESEGWEVHARALLEEELRRNTFPSGLNRELASDYHVLVAELGLLAVAEADRAGRPLSDGTLQLLCGTLDAAASIVDVRLGGPRQGDSDDGRALLLDDPGGNRWESLLALGGSIFGTPEWWPVAEVDTKSVLVSSLAVRHPGVEHQSRRRSHFADAGLTIMRSTLPDGRELWCRCDAGPHGYLSIAAHAHADALSVEVRVDGVEVLADPGTYCYQGNQEWRGFFRSTVGHNAVEVGGVDQSVSGGPTLWSSTRIDPLGRGRHPRRRRGRSLGRRARRVRPTDSSCHPPPASRDLRTASCEWSTPSRPRGPTRCASPSTSVPTWRRRWKAWSCGCNGRLREGAQEHGRAPFVRRGDLELRQRPHPTGDGLVLGWVRPQAASVVDRGGNQLPSRPRAGDVADRRLTPDDGLPSARDGRRCGEATRQLR